MDGQHPTERTQQPNRAVKLCVSPLHPPLRVGAETPASTTREEKVLSRIAQRRECEARRGVLVLTLEVAKTCLRCTKARGDHLVVHSSATPQVEPTQKGPKLAALKLQVQHQQHRQGECQHGAWFRLPVGWGRSATGPRGESERGGPCGGARCLGSGGPSRGRRRP